jgi:uncharacterized protein with HEPN domain
MTSLEEKKLLKDILNTIISIDEHLEGRRSFEEYKANKTKRRAVERELEIIGEAVSNLLKLNPDIIISYARLIVDLRNKIIHAYDNVNDIIIWKVVMKDIPVLQKEAEELLKES